MFKVDTKSFFMSNLTLSAMMCAAEYEPRDSMKAMNDDPDHREAMAGIAKQDFDRLAESDSGLIQTAYGAINKADHDTYMRWRNRER